MYAVLVLVEVFKSYSYPVYISSLTTQLLTAETSQIITQYISMFEFTGKYTHVLLQSRASE